MVVLAGFMASGKTTVGRMLADRLGWEFVDFDEEIERRTGRSVGEVFRRGGEAEFRRMEADLTAEVAGRERLVLAPGGGWITQPALLQGIRSGALVVWLRISPEEALRRAEADGTHRPLLAGARDPLDRARALLQHREPFYRLADAVIDVDGRSPDEIADAIATMVRSGS